MSRLSVLPSLLSAGVFTLSALATASAGDSFQRIYDDSAALEALQKSSPADSMALKKLDSTLLWLHHEGRGLAALDVGQVWLESGTPFPEMFQSRSGHAIADITVVGDAEAAAKQLGAISGVQITGVAETPAYGVISAAVPSDKLLEVARPSEVRSVAASQAATGRAPAGKLASRGAADNQAETGLNIDHVNELFFGTITGDGIDVGTLSDSADTRDALGGDGISGFAESQATGDLPPDDRLLLIQDSAGESDEGRAMMEHIYDLAPGVDTFGFATAFGGKANFANNIANLAISGMDIINDDVVYFSEPIYQDGVIAQAVIDYVDDGGIYFALNHNYANLSREFVWNDTDNDNLHDFATGPVDELIGISLAANSEVTIGLQWTEPWANAQTDLEIDVYDNAGNTVLFSSNDANVGGNPVDLVTINSGAGGAGGFLAIRYNAGSVPTGLTAKLVAYDNGASRFTFDEYPGLAAGTLTPHAGTPKSIAIGAAPFFAIGTAETFSGRGPFRQFFDSSGNALDDNSTMLKPDFLSIDNCNTTFFGQDIPQDADTFPNFSGTSAATPNAAAVGALMLDAAGGPGTINQDSMRRYLRQASVDIAPALHDIVNGFGRIDAVGAVSAARGPFNNNITPVYINPLGDFSFESTLDSSLERENVVFAMATAGVGQASLTETGPADMMLLIFDGDFPRGIDYDSGPDDDPLVEEPLGAGALYNIQVQGEELFGTDEDYSLTFDGPEQDMKRLFPGNEGDAVEIYSMTSERDIKFYNFTGPQDIQGNLNITCTSNDFNPIMLLFETDGTEIQRSIDEAGGAATFQDLLTLTNPNPGEGLVVLVAAEDYVDFGEYTLTVDFDTLGQPSVLRDIDIVDAAVRPNPVTGEVSLLSGALDIGDAWHALWVPQTESVDVESRATSVDTEEITGGIYSPIGNNLGFDGPAGIVNVNDVVVDDNQQHVYRTFSFSDPTKTQATLFTLNIFTEPSAPMNTAEEITLDDLSLSSVSGEISAGLNIIGENDYFVFTAPSNAAGDATITMDTSVGILDGAVKFYDAAGNLLEELDDGGLQVPETINYNGIVAGETYYILCHGSDAAPLDRTDNNRRGSYAIRVELSTTPPNPSDGDRWFIGQPGIAQREDRDLSLLHH